MSSLNQNNKRGFPVAETQAHATEASDDPTKRDILYIGTATFAAVGIARGVVWPLIHQMNPAENVKALASIEVDISQLLEGHQIKVLWQGKAVFIRYRTAEDIARARADDTAADIKDHTNRPTDAERVIDDNGVSRPEILVLVGVCTHLGCVPLADRGDYDGWFCPCHGSHYDTAGRIRKGPAPTNLVIPPYEFIEEFKIQIG
jgi:ubiquinol-cytochrome c reductase iron-sulfur subunit